MRDALIFLTYFFDLSRSRLLYLLFGCIKEAFLLVHKYRMTSRFFTEFTGEPFAEYTVRSVDIDFEGHMNNVAYIRALFGLFSRKELEEMAPSEIELQYKVSCYEGDRLLWYRQKMDDALEICAKFENGTAVFFARIR